MERDHLIEGRVATANTQALLIEPMTTAKTAKMKGGVAR